MNKILVIDDMQDNLISIKALLKNYLPDCAVFTSQLGKEGISLAKTKKPDVILLDIIRPEMDGYAVCRELKNNSETKHIPIIMLTAIKTDMESRIKGMDLGADAFIAKPFDPLELTAQIKVMLRIKSAEDKLQEERRDLESIVLERTEELRKSYDDLMQEAKQRKLIKKEMKSTKAFLDGVINTIADPVFVKDEKRKFILVNDTLCKAVGRSREELLGEDGDDMFSQKQSEVFQKIDLEVLKSGEENLNEEFLSNLSSGEVQTIVTHKSRYTDPSGNHFLVGVIRDITESKKAANELFKSEEKYRLLARNSIDLIWQMDLRLNFTYVSPNSKEVFGYTQEEWIGTNLSKYATTKEFFNMARQALKSLKNYKTFNFVMFEAKMLKRNGEEFPVEIIGKILLNKHGLPVALQGSTRDITERKQAEEALQKTHEDLQNLTIYMNTKVEEEKKRIARNLHDELGQFLTALKINLTLLSKNDAREEIFLEKYEAMNEMLDSSIQLVQDVTKELRSTVLDDLGIIAAIDSYLLDFQETSGIKTNFICIPQNFSVDPDLSSSIYLIFKEIFTNIIRHANTKKVTVKFRNFKTNISLMIQDYGIGITEEQISNPLSFGLIGIRERLNIWQGTMKVEGIPGKGTTIKIRIPLSYTNKSNILAGESND